MITLRALKIWGGRCPAFECETIRTTRCSY